MRRIRVGLTPSELLIQTKTTRIDRPATTALAQIYRRVRRSGARMGLDSMPPDCSTGHTNRHPRFGSVPKYRGVSALSARADRILLIAKSESSDGSPIASVRGLHERPSSTAFAKWRGPSRQATAPQRRDLFWRSGRCVRPAYAEDPRLRVPGSLLSRDALQFAAL
jgi:hypothetical protein